MDLSQKLDLSWNTSYLIRETLWILKICKSKYSECYGQLMPHASIYMDLIQQNWITGENTWGFHPGMIWFTLNITWYNFTQTFVEKSAGGMGCHTGSSFFVFKNSLSVFFLWEIKAPTKQEWVGSQAQSGDRDMRISCILPPEILQQIQWHLSNLWNTVWVLAEVQQGAHCNCWWSAKTAQLQSPCSTVGISPPHAQPWRWVDWGSFGS